MDGFKEGGVRVQRKPCSVRKEVIFCGSEPLNMMCTIMSFIKPRDGAKFCKALASGLVKNRASLVVLIVKRRMCAPNLSWAMLSLAGMI